MGDEPPTMPSFDPVETGTSYDHSYYNHPAIPKDTIKPYYDVTTAIME
jgi:hypothetical protein